MDGVEVLGVVDDAAGGHVDVERDAELARLELGEGAPGEPELAPERDDVYRSLAIGEGPRQAARHFDTTRRDAPSDSAVLGRQTRCIWFGIRQ